MHVPVSLEEAPLRRQDKRALNALRRRRADKKLLLCLFLTILALVLAALAAGSLALLEDPGYQSLRLVSLVVLVTSLSLTLFSMEICIRLRNQTKRVKDKHLMKTKNLHEVKHWIEPELVSLGWGHEVSQYEYG